MSLLSPLRPILRNGNPLLTFLGNALLDLYIRFLVDAWKLLLIRSLRNQNPVEQESGFKTRPVYFMSQHGYAVYSRGFRTPHEQLHFRII